MKTALLVAYHFPPVGGLGAAGSQRAIKFIRHFPANGWRPVVLTLRESSYASYLEMDEGLRAGVPESQIIVRTGVVEVLEPLLRLKSRISSVLKSGHNSNVEANEPSVTDAPLSENVTQPRTGFQTFKDSITDLFEIPDEVSSWLLPAVLAGRRAIKRHNIEMIVATGRPWTSLVIGAVLKKISKKPLVVDFRDPWMTNPYRLGYTPIKNKLEAWLEAWVVRTADLVVANTKFLEEEFAERFGPEVARRCVTIRNGFDPDEFEQVSPAKRPVFADGAMHIVHPGFLYGKRDPKNLLLALASLREHGAISKGDLMIELIGPVELDYSLSAEIDRLSIADFIQLRGPVSYADSIAAVAACDVALLLQPGTATQIPSKLFEYIGFGKRIISIAPAESSVTELVRNYDLGVSADADSVDAIADGLLQSLTGWRDYGADFRISPESQSQFDVRRAVRSLCDAMTSHVSGA